jgi:hypothetical protein
MFEYLKRLTRRVYILRVSLRGFCDSPFAQSSADALEDSSATGLTPLRSE